MACDRVFDDHGGGEPALALPDRLVLEPGALRPRSSPCSPVTGARSRSTGAGTAIRSATSPISALEEMVRDALAVLETTGIEQSSPSPRRTPAGWRSSCDAGLARNASPQIVHMDWMVVEPSDRYMGLLRKLQAEVTWAEARDTLFTIWRAGIEHPTIDEAIDVMAGRPPRCGCAPVGKSRPAYARGSGSPFAAYSRAGPRAPRAAPVRAAAGSGLPRRAARFRADAPLVPGRTVPATTHFSMVETAAEAATAIEAFVSGEEPPA